MLALTASGSLADQRAAADRYAAELAERGWPVVRTKVGAAPWNPGVPRSDAEALADRPDQYCEHHVKLLLDDDTLKRVCEAVRRYDARLSRNARRRRADGRHGRFATRRGCRTGAEEARRRLDELLSALAGLGPVLGVEREFVVLDDRLSPDRGRSAPEQKTSREAPPSAAPPGGTRIPRAGAPEPPGGLAARHRRRPGPAASGL